MLGLLTILAAALAGFGDLGAWTIVAAAVAIASFSYSDDYAGRRRAYEIGLSNAWQSTAVGSCVTAVVASGAAYACGMLLGLMQS